MNKTRQITIETHSLTVIKTNGANRPAYCEHCGETAATFTPEQIAGFLQLDLSEVCRRVEAKQIHLANSRRGSTLICGNSLSDSDTAGRTQKRI